MPLYDLRKIHNGFANRFAWVHLVSLGHGAKKEDWDITESDFPSWTPREFDKYVSPNGRALGVKSRFATYGNLGF